MQNRKRSCESLGFEKINYMHFSLNLLKIFRCYLETDKVKQMGHIIIADTFLPILHMCNMHPISRKITTSVILQLPQLGNKTGFLVRFCDFYQNIVLDELSWPLALLLYFV